jgi:hypothetical protein
MEEYSMKTYRIWIDCEWNDWKGDLISMALVAEDGGEWYQVLECKSPSPWVAEHVIPKLGKKPVTYQFMQQSLYQFLRDYNRVHLIADWPEDIQHFCEALIVAPGERLPTSHVTMEIKQIESESKIPHQALADARAIKEADLAAQNLHTLSGSKQHSKS